VPSLNGLERRDIPFTHWLTKSFLPADKIREINRTWPDETDGRWFHERREWTHKSAIMFPRRLHPAAQAVAAELYSPAILGDLQELVGYEVFADPWFLDGPLMPRVGGGLHEIQPGGLLKMHVDFSHHPAGLTRALNLLIYLNEDWKDEWGGALQLGDDGMLIYPRAGTAVLFETNGSSWHGHPEPLACPRGRTRRSLALYYYRKPTAPPERYSTLYRNAKA